ncbi:hypothetical protein [Bacillus phage SPO1L1]|nr:hypothetical protein [Bacillus phage SPO1L1]
MDDLQYLLDTQLLPIDFSPSKCQEYSEDYNLSIKNRLAHAIEEVKAEGEQAMEIINYIEDSIAGFAQQGIEITKVMMHPKTYELIKGHSFNAINTEEIIMDDSIRLDEVYLYFEQDEEDE